MEHRDILRQMQEYYDKRAPIYDHSMRYDDPEWMARHVPLVEFLREALAGRDVLEIACGPGYWTREVAEFARSIAATDANASVLAEARKKTYPNENVIFYLADAFALQDIGERFTGAFAVDWWAHIPKSKRGDFICSLHSHLSPSAHVVLVDQLPRPDSLTGNYDREGNHYQTRKLPTGELFSVIKNFTGEQEYTDLLAPLGCTGIQYRQFSEVRRCALLYTTPALEARTEVDR